MMYFMTSTFAKVMFSLIRKVPVCFFRSRKCAYSNAHTITGLAARSKYYEKIFHRLESDLARNNIHPNNKQQPEITNKNTGK